MQNRMLTTKREIAQWLDSNDIDAYTISDDLTVDVSDSVDLEYCKLTHLPVRFGKVRGTFNVSNNSLTTLEGSPREVTGNFFASHNQLVDLKGAPAYVRQTFDCAYNNLTTLADLNTEIGWGLACTGNKLTSLQSPANLDRAWLLYCAGNMLTDLKGCPPRLAELDCSNNRIASMDDIPKVAHEHFDRVRLKSEMHPTYFEGTVAKAKHGNIRLAGNPALELIDMVRYLNEHKLPIETFMKDHIAEDLQRAQNTVELEQRLQAELPTKGQEKLHTKQRKI
ncbi:E3 ubiquitin-protein ligase SspH2 [Pandoraea morbifera]|uniref:E3 ubiquitin-protein ligase SspH2 n=1 Tax=Pandoraea morbifera TaxID=2508300 RepID=A0A5E4S0Q8_9BURK|nr:hypothetical protein [Pandoraea morbifera]VVD69356.1 E3 ubiquitin-protein ligase SspH2 [Pandoraea morbifera]